MGKTKITKIIPWHKATIINTHTLIYIHMSL